MRIVLAQPRGFCAGVIRAIEIVRRALEVLGPPVYVRHEIVHNEYVVDKLREEGAIFVDELDQIPSGAVTIFSAHGVSRAVRDEAKRRGLHIIDATCPLVTKVHNQGQNYVKSGYTVVVIGEAGHPEVVGTMGSIEGEVKLVQHVDDVRRLDIANDAPLAYVTQTTLSVDDTRDVIGALKQRFPQIAGPDVSDICYAAQNRQAAVRELARLVDVVLVVGSRNSHNSNRLCDVAAESGVPAYLIGGGRELNPEWVRDAQTVGLTAGASTPEQMVESVIAALASLEEVEVCQMPGLEENISFRLPAEIARRH